MFDRGLHLTRQALGRQTAAMPHDLYLIRLIHCATKRAFPGERLWTGSQLVHPATIRFLRVRNREGCDVYIHAYTDGQNSGYILVDLDHPRPGIIEAMRSNGHEPCVILQTSPGNLQAWVQVSATPIEPPLASAAGKELALLYGGDLASTDWRHLGRLAGFTNQKPQRRNWCGHAPWVKVLYAQAGLASQAGALLQKAAHSVCNQSGTTSSPGRLTASHPDIESAASQIYADCLRRLHILERFPHPDWSIADKWIAKELLRHGTPVGQVAAVLRDGSPGFPRRHSHPEDYLCRTLARAVKELEAFPFPGAPHVWNAHAGTVAFAASARSNCTGD